ncbi:MAG: hypothetical protein C0407_01890 [Desulfobacca sp.]|nr:hypothetical protein [Desulfobacca sp.]
MWVKDLVEKLPSFVLTRWEGGTNFPIANTLRHFFNEYINRFAIGGFQSYPTSFNVIESFLVFSYKYFAFDIKEEREHLLRLDDYLDWYTSGRFPEEPPALMDILLRGVVHSYTLAAPLNDFHLSTTDGSKLALFGVSMVRHSTELSMVAVLGESPAYPRDEDIPEIDEGSPAKGRESIQPAPELGVKDRFLEEAPQLARIITLVRFDLVARRFNVRYINMDVGKSYSVFTDDPLIFSPEDKTLSPSERRERLQTYTEGLNRYASVFSALASLIFLPAFFIAEHLRVTTTKFGTKLLAQRSSAKVQKAIKLLGRDEVSFARQVECLHSISSCNITTLDIDPPDLKFETSGFWRNLAPGEIGTDKSGQPLVGKT